MPTLLRSIRTTAGFLEKCPVEFAPGLNCVIGARGTCKSTLIESIRFAFNADQRRVERLTHQANRQSDNDTDGLIAATLGAGSIRCDLEAEAAAGTTRHVVERELGSPPRLFQDGVREHTALDILEGIEIFSQGDLQRIAEDGNDKLRLDLIDKPHASRVAALDQQRENHAQELRRIGPDLRTLRTQVANLRQELQPLAALQEQFRQAQASAPALPPELERERLRYERRRIALEQVATLDAARRGATQLLQQLDSSATRAAEAHGILVIESPVDVTDAVEHANAVVRLFREALSLREQLEELDATELRARLGRRFEEENARFYQLRQEQQAINESLKQQQHLARQIEDLEGKARDLEELQRRERDLLAKRAAARAAMAVIDDELYDLRVREIEAINQEHGSTVHLTLRTGSGARGYVERLSQLLTGSRIRAQDEVAAALADTFSPATLIDIAESGSGQSLSDVLNRDIGQMNRVVAHLGDHAELYTLESEPPSVQLEITLFDNGQPKRVESLSKGQKATALLPLILRPLGYPLLFDQPEDDLDNNFIFRSLIKTVQSLKTKRQLIFVTHNANIPVLGMADRVIVMRMASPTLADAARVGSVDERKQDILDLLEGGADAFRMREQSYHELLDREGPFAANVPSPVPTLPISPVVPPPARAS
jgi:AAA domain, putative AbiEii toxin, Type IV TA system